MGRLRTALIVLLLVLWTATIAAPLAYVRDGRTMVQLRAFVEHHLSGTVHYDAHTRQTTVSLPRRSPCVFTLHSPHMRLGDAWVTMPAPAVMRSGHLYVPLRALALDRPIDWFPPYARISGTAHHLYAVDEPLAFLMDAVDSRDAAATRQALRTYSAQVNAHDARGETPLLRALRVPGSLSHPWHTNMWEVTTSPRDIVSVLLAYGADPRLNRVMRAHDIGHETSPIHLAVQWGDPALVTLLLAHGGSVHARNSRGWTPLHMVGRYGHAELARLLLDHGAPVDALDAAGLTPLQRVFQED